MDYIATQKFVRQSPRKVRLVANQVKDLPLEQAVIQLVHIERKATLVLLKTLRQAMANAQHNHGVSPDDLRIKTIIIGDGPRYKRFNAVSRGRAHSIIKRSCHVRVVLTDQQQMPKSKAQIIESKKKSVGSSQENQKSNVESVKSKVRGNSNQDSLVSKQKKAKSLLTKSATKKSKLK